jgi:hypothetical protein
MSRKFLLNKIILIAMIFSVTACASFKKVQPWEKGNLAKPEMTFEGDVLDSAYVEHTYFSKEGSSGGVGVGGGGCGCN